ncbi:MAG: MarR family transcriptional regulator, partial [Atopobiaceae bacterium]|nr:MarR family transcriptional regulator [Atopobiaceae bacterium]
TPLLKRLEKHGYVARRRSDKDERSVIITLTQKGRDLRERALGVPSCISNCIHMTPEELIQLKLLREKMLCTLS